MIKSILLFLVSLAYYYNVGKMKQLIIMILLLATRTDNIVWLLSLLILDTIRFNTNYNLRYNALTFLFLMIFYGSINLIAGNQGFWIVFYNTLKLLANICFEYR